MDVSCFVKLLLVIRITSGSVVRASYHTDCFTFVRVIVISLIVYGNIPFFYCLMGTLPPFKTYQTTMVAVHIELILYRVQPQLIHLKLIVHDNSH